MQQKKLLNEALSTKKVIMNNEDFSTWNVTDLLFERKLERTISCPDRLAKVELEISRREKSAEARENEYAVNKEIAYKQFKTKSQIWGALFLIAETLMFSLLAVGSSIEIPTFVAQLVFIPGAVVFFGCWFYCFFDTIGKRRWDWLIGISSFAFFTVPYYLIKTTRYD